MVDARLVQGYSKPNTSCRGCGWMIRNDMATTPAAVREHYCIICDPNGGRENRILRQSNKDRFDLARPWEV